MAREKKSTVEDHLPLPVAEQIVLVSSFFKRIKDAIVSGSQADQKPVQSEERFRSLVTNMPSVFYRCANDSHRTVDFISARIKDISGYAPEEFMGNSARQSLSSICHPDDRRFVSESIEKAARQRRVVILEYRLLNRDGTVRWIQETGQPVIAEGDRTPWFEGAIQDITELKQARRMRDRMLSILEATSDLVSIALPNEEVIYGNRALRELVGVFPEDDLATVQIRHVHPEAAYRQISRVALPKAIEAGTYAHETLIRKRDGSEVPVSQVIICHRNEHREVEYFSTIMRDISGRKRAEEERDQLLAQVHHLKKMDAIGQLAGGVAHDFNNLLTSIVGNADLALMELESRDSVRRALIEIQKAADIATNLTRQLLTFGRKQAVRQELVNLSDLVEQLLNMLHRLIGEHITLSTDLQRPSRSVMVDRGQIEQTIMNVVLNACDAMPRGGHLTIRIADCDLDERYASRHPDIKPGPFVRMEISDTGHGMDEEIQQRIFEPFFTTKEEGKGIGLGLSSVFGTVQQHKGIIEVDSIVSQGTTVKIYLPAEARLTASQIAALEQAEVEVAGEETILAAEDNPAIRKVIDATLSRHGYDVLLAENGAEALRLIEQRQGKIDLLLTDMVMPVMDGGELSKRVGQLYPGMKVIFSSGYSDEVFQRHGIDRNDVHFIAKPFTPAALLKKIREVLELPRRDPIGPMG